mgnify:CR=1 FL=1
MKLFYSGETGHRAESDLSKRQAITLLAAYNKENDD